MGEKSGEVCGNSIPSRQGYSAGLHVSHTSLSGVKTCLITLQCSPQAKGEGIIIIIGTVECGWSLILHNVNVFGPSHFHISPESILGHYSLRSMLGRTLSLADRLLYPLLFFCGIICAFQANLCDDEVTH